MYGFCYISSKYDPIATKRKANILIELSASIVIDGIDIGHDCDLKFSRSNKEFSGVRIYSWGDFWGPIQYKDDVLPV